MQTWKDTAFDHVFAPGKGTIVANLFNTVRVEEASNPVELETAFLAYVPHRYMMQPVLVRTRRRTPRPWKTAACPWTRTTRKPGG